MTSAGAAVALACTAAGLLVWPAGRTSRFPDDGAGRDVPTVGAGAPDAAARARRERLTTMTAVVGLGVAVVLTLGVQVGLPAAVVVSPLVGAAIGWLQRRVPQVAPDRSLALALDLAAAVLRSGRPVADALLAAAPAARPAAAAALVRVSRLLSMGAEPRTAWSTAAAGGAGVLDPVVAVAIRSHASGIRLADAFERLAVEIRADCVSAALARAHRAGVRAMAPLAACFLPSFVCLGIVPVIVGVAGTALRGVR